MKKKLKIAVIMGGVSNERDISIASGRMVAESLDRKKYEVLPIEISRQGKWLAVPQKSKLKQTGAEKIKKLSKTKASVPATIDEAVAKKGIDLAFLALHGPFGEDGTIQGMLEILGIPYTCSGVLASALAMDKVKTKEVLNYHQIPMPRDFVFNQEEFLKDSRKILKIITNKFKGPVVIKPNQSGSSIGASIVYRKEELAQAIKKSLLHDQVVLVEEYLGKKEITVATLGNENPIALPVVEIVPPLGKFFDFKSKYSGASQEICPARIPSGLAKKAQKIAIKVHQLLGCRGITRVDMMIKAGRLFVLELNTIPGLTKESLAPKAAAAAGISFSQLLDKLVNLALEK